MVPPPQQANAGVGQSYSAAQIAAALGVSKRTILHRLRYAEPSAKINAGGNQADAWALGALPQGLSEQLLQAAQRRGFRNSEHLLASANKPWAPAVAWANASERSRYKATRLQRALAPALARASDLTLSEAEFETLGMRDYKNVFGFEISGRHWRRLFNRTIERDGGTENFARMEIYLDERPGRAADQVAVEHRNQQLESAIASFGNPAAPTAAERAFLWATAFHEFEAQVRAGKPQQSVKRDLVAFLFRAAPYMGATIAALKKQFGRKYSAWVKGDRRPAAVEDQRSEKSGRFRAPALSQADKDKLVGEAVLFHGGKRAPAWRALRSRGDLDEELLAYYLANPGNKSYVPRKIREAVKHEISALEDIHHGPRQAQLRGAHISRDWSFIPAGDWYQADDVTLPIYYYEPDGNGWFTLWRGQCLVMIDLRSTLVLGYVLLSSRNYNSLAIRTLVTKVCDEYGLPRKGFYFERGIWQSSKILKGTASKGAVSLAETEKGLMDLGLRFIHARLPRAKPIERALGALQNFMEGEPGYCGRDERNDKYERVQKAKLEVESRKAHPGEHFLSAEQWVSRLGEICTAYNAERQGGKMTRGLSPDEAFHAFQNHSDPQVKFDANCRFLLAHHRRPVRVTANGITLRFGNQVFVYRNADTGRLLGQTVVAWFNPEAPEVLSVTDTERRNPFAVERSLDIPAMDAPDNLLAEEMERIAAHQAYAKSYYRVLKAKFAPQFRRNWVTAETAALGAEMATQTETAKVRRDERTALDTRVRGLCRTLDMPPVPVTRQRPETPQALSRLKQLMDETET